MGTDKVNDPKFRVYANTDGEWKEITIVLDDDKGETPVFRADISVKTGAEA